MKTKRYGYDNYYLFPLDSSRTIEEVKRLSLYLYDMMTCTYDAII